jgi:hypothetical protein
MSPWRRFTKRAYWVMCIVFLVMFVVTYVHGCAAGENGFPARPRQGAPL